MTKKLTYDELMSECKNLQRQVSAYRDALDALRRSDERHWTILDTMEEGYTEIDLSGKFTFVNNAEAKMFGYSREELVGMSYHQYTSEQTSRVLYEDFFRIYKTGEPVLLTDYEIIMKNGAKRIHEISAALIRDDSGRPVGFRGVSRDVTEHKQAEEALKKSEAKYRFLTENMNDIVWTADLDFNVTYDSPVVERILGYKAQERMEQKATAMLTPESYAQALEVLSAELKRDQDEGTDPDRSIKLELEYYHKNGSTVWMECVVSAIRDDSGKIIGIHGVSRDITDRRRAESAMKESEERFRSLIQKSLDIIIILDRNGFMIYETPSLESILGYQPGYLIGKSPFELIHPADLKRVANDLDEVYLKTNPGTPTEFRFRKADGTWVYLEAIGQNLLEDPAINGIVITSRDITERKRSEDVLRASEAKYRQLYEGMMDAFVSTDMAGYIKEYNETFLNMLGYGSEEIKSLPYKDITPEIWHAFEASIIQKQVLPRGYSALYEKEYRRKDGTVLPIELRTILIRDETGEPTGMWAIVRDITERKRVEEELLTHRDHLEDLVRERTNELRNTYEQLREENDIRKAVEYELNLRKQELEEMNSALRVLLKQREEDKVNMEMNIISNIKTSVLPYIEKLELSGLAESQMRVSSMIKSLLGELISPFIRNVSSEFLGFTPKEIQVASLIKEGKNSKEIAEILNISLNTVHTYRYKIRIKTGLKNSKVNLRSYLQTLR